jgi:hypothetical protein
MTAGRGQMKNEPKLSSGNVQSGVFGDADRGKNVSSSKQRPRPKGKEGY